MANEERTDKSIDELTERAWKIAEDSAAVVLITLENERAIARPMSAHVDREQGTFQFLTSAASRKIPQGDDRMVTLACSHGNSYVSFIGRGSVSNDRELIRRLWTPYAKAWWESPDDPDIRVFTVYPSEAEIWDGPNKVAAAALMLSAAITGAQPKIGDHARIRP